jgi:2'-hydroxyisoflavone reductase
VWVPPEDPMRGLTRIDNRRAVANGLRLRPIGATARDTLDWFRTLPAERQASLRAGLPAEREARVLTAWRARSEG